jgi:hypothetical protein
MARRANIDRPLGFLLLACSQACASIGGIDDLQKVECVADCGASVDAGAGDATDAAPEAGMDVRPGVRCPPVQDLWCSPAAGEYCCLPQPPEQPRCERNPQACPGFWAFSCDDALDCGGAATGKVCCALRPDELSPWVATCVWAKDCVDVGPTKALLCILEAPVCLDSRPCVQARGPDFPYAECVMK